ncbi:MAG: vitamin B12-dependent ribonucleotide reductase, partial [Chitinophagia bacterium]|nr:vitamin B12-dependent ribonucleotide reductase [Chitinophagia bacterium]
NTACNLASLNLRKYYNEDTGVFDVEGFEYMVRLWTVVLEISVLMAQFPSHEVARLSYDYRTLGLGYANIGSLLMVNGIPYDSEEGRAIAAAITAIMTGTAYKTSAEMAMHLGTFAKYEENKSHFMRVMRNHRAAAYDADDAYEGLDMKPMSINAKYCPAYLLSAATKAWDDAVKWGELYGYRNAQTTVLAPTGTIGMIMDCDTTGIEPDFALVKHKKLSGGGYFKLINQSLPAALKKLGYSTQEIDAIVKYTIGVNSIDNAPFINAPTLLSKGFNANDIKKLNNACATALHISHIFSAGVLGNDCMERIGLTPAQYGNPEFNVLQFLGFITEQINAANKYVCGMMTIEGAPYLKPEHYAVFDCANKCGEHGTRFIHPHGHLYMMGATQPFISGAISKTVNLPYEATMEEMRECYFLSWKIGIKACALYRDGSKLSQPLNTANSSDNKDSKENTATASAQAPEADAATTARLIDMSALSDKELLDELNKRMQASEDTILKRKLSTIVERQQLPFKRKGYTIKAKVGGQALFLRTGEYSDGTLGEIFIDMAKEGATMRSLLNSFAIAISVGLQYGVPLEEFVEKFTFTRFEPSGPVDHPNIKYATSVLDYIFRLLAWEYLGNEDMIHVKQTPEETNPNAESAEPTKKQELGNIRVAAPQKTKQPTPQTADVAHNNAYTAKVHTDKSADAPACSQCGNITYRNGTCYICPNCGTTTGCS